MGRERLLEESDTNRTWSSILQSHYGDELESNAGFMRHYSQKLSQMSALASHFR